MTDHTEIIRDRRFMNTAGTVRTDGRASGDVRHHSIVFDLADEIVGRVEKSEKDIAERFRDKAESLRHHATNPNAGPPPAPAPSQASPVVTVSGASVSTVPTDETPPPARPVEQAGLSSVQMTPVLGEPDTTEQPQVAEPVAETEPAPAPEPEPVAEVEPEPEPVSEAAPVDLDQRPVTELLDLATEHGVVVADGASREEIVAALSASGVTG